MAGIAIVPNVSTYNPNVDLVRTTLARLGRTFADTLRDIDLPLTRLLINPLVEEGGGTGYEHRHRILVKGTARFVTLYEPVSEVQKDLFEVTRSHWVHSEKHMILDNKELDMQSGAEKIVDLIDGRWSEVYEDSALLWEDSMSGLPTSNSDTRNIRGIRYWFPETDRDTATPDYVGGFGGTTVRLGGAGGTDDTNIGGADRSTARNLRLRSWAANYSGDIDDWFLDTLRRARTRTAFRTITQIRGEKPSDMKPNYLFMPHAQADLIEKRANRGPDDYQNDINRFVDPTIAGMQPVRVPTWDSLAMAPIVGIKTSKLKVQRLNGRWNKQLEPRPGSNQTEVVDTPLVSTLLMHCTDPRSGGFNISIAGVGG